jgi:hypothetical protein
MEVDANLIGIAGLVVSLMVIIATILTAINTARIAETLQRIEHTLDQRNFK